MNRSNATKRRADAISRLLVHAERIAGRPLGPFRGRTESRQANQLAVIADVLDESLTPKPAPKKPAAKQAAKPDSAGRPVPVTDSGEDDF